MSEDQPYRNQAIFDAIAAATSIKDGAIEISVQAFLTAFTSHRDRASADIIHFKVTELPQRLGNVLVPVYAPCGAADASGFSCCGFPEDCRRLRPDVRLAVELPLSRSL